jgi:hypothetical protein
MLVINLIIILLLSLIIYQDFKHRAIHWFIFPILFLMFLIYGLTRIPLIIYLKDCAFNLFFLLIQMLLLSVYYYLRGLSFKSILNEIMGLADIVLLVSMTFAFSIINFIAFYLSAMIFSLLVWLILQFIPTQKKNLVPLAGLISFYLALIVLVNIFYSQFERLNDNYLIHLIYG